MHHLWFSNVKCEKAEGGKVILKTVGFPLHTHLGTSSNLTEGAGRD